MNLGEKICAKLLTSGPDESQIQSVNIGEKGRVSFRVLPAFLTGTDVRLQAQVEKLKDLSCLGSFSVDYIGQLIIRKNIGAFLPALSRMTLEDYNQKLMLFNHLHFTIQRIGDLIEFTLHVSYLHDVLLDLFLSNVEGNKENGAGPQNGCEEPST